MALLMGLRLCDLRRRSDSRPNADACLCKDGCGRLAAVLDVEVYLKGFSYQQQIAGYE